MAFIDYKNKKAGLNLYISYTKLFIITTLFSFGIFFLKDKILITNDGIASWITGDIWFAKAIKKFFSELIFNHKIYFPQWILYAGEGGDVFQLYGNEFGDPFKLLYIFFPESLYVYVYVFAQFLRIYFCGITFITMCRKLKESSFYGILAGAITYTFCGYNILSISRHPHFINPLIYFPLLVLGIEKIFKNEKPYIYIFSLILFFMSNAYFSYMIVIATIIYVIIKIIVNRYSFNLIFKYLFNFFIFALIAVLISSVIFIPKLMHLFSDNRKSQTFAKMLFYPLNYYETLISSFITYYSTQWRILSYSAIVYISITVVFLNKRKTFIKCLIIISLLCICIPFFGKLFNGGGYVTNRFTFMLALLFSYCITNTFDDMFNLNSYMRVVVYVILFGIFLICNYLKYGHGNLFYMQMIITFIMFVLICFPTYKSVSKPVIILLTMISVIINCYNFNVLYGTVNLAFSYEGIKDDLYANESNALLAYKNKINDNEYSRYVSDTQYMKSDFKINDFYYFANNNGMLTNQSTIEYYGSIVNPYIDEYNRFIGNTNYASHWWETYCDNSSSLNVLSSIKYYLHTDEDVNNELNIEENEEPILDDNSIVDILENYVANDDVNVDGEEESMELSTYKTKHNEKLFGYNYLDNINGYKVYKNNFYIPIFYTYGNVLDKETAYKYNPVERHELMANNAVLDNQDKYCGGIKVSNTTTTSKNIKYVIEKITDDIVINKNSIIIGKKNQEINLIFNGMKNSENYVYIKNFNFKSLPEYDFYYNKDNEFKGYNYNIDLENKFAQVFTNSKYKSLLNNKKYFGYGQQIYSIELITSLGVSKRLLQLTEYEQSYSDRHDFAINMGYTNEKLTSVKIRFPYVGIYTFDDINIICQPLAYLKNAVNNLKSEQFQNTKIYNDEISTQVNLSKDKFICLAVPYHYGWKAYIDGKETKIYKTNIMHMGIDASEGLHSITFKYSNPFIKMGCILSALGMIVLATYILYDKKYLRMHQNGKNNETKNK